MSDYKAIDNITIDRGETFNYYFQVEPGGEVLLLNDYNIIAEIRKNKSRQSDLIATFNVTVDGQPVPNAAPTDNEIRLYLTQAETVAQPFYDNSEGWFDVLFISPGGERVYYLAGRVNIDGSVTDEP